MNKLVSLISGILFGLGLGFSGMMDPEKIIGFLDITGQWDPSLALVMGGALMVTVITFPLILKREHPLFDKKFYIPTKTDLDHFVLAGPALFGIGWGLSGICPGPGISNLAVGSTPVLIFVAVMIGFLIITDLVIDKLSK